MRGWVLALVVGCGAPAGTEPLRQEQQGEPSTASSAASAAPVVETPPPEPVDDDLVLIAGGDVNLGREQGQMILRDPSYDPFRYVKKWLLAADLRFVNLESQLSDQKGETQSPDHHLVFTGPPQGADVLERVGIDVVSLANNHAWDYGRRGFDETLANLARVDIAAVGVSGKANEQYEPTIVNVKGWSIAWFAVTHIWNAGRYTTHPGRHHVAWASYALLRENVKKARAQHDLVLVSYHGGPEYTDTPFPPEKGFVEAAMADPIDALIGHHPHVPRGVAWFDGRPALYSLGNLVFDKRSDKRWERTSFMARITFRRDKTRKLELCPYHLKGHTPHPFEGAQREADEREIREHLVHISKPIGGTELGPTGDDGCFEALPAEPEVTDARAADRTRR